MKVHKLTISVIDFDELGAKGVLEEVRGVPFPNDCVHLDVLSVETWDIGDWSDDHPLNSVAIGDEAAKALFATKPESILTGGDK